MGRISTARRWARHTGIRPVAEVTGSWLAKRVGPAWIDRNSAPTIKDFTQLSGTLVTSGTAFLDRLGWAQADIGETAAEFREVIQLLDERYRHTKPAFPARYAIEAETSFFVYAATRLLKPATIVETGVADGRSSFLFLAALERNGTGRLHSFDIDPNAGGLVGEHERWHLTIADHDAPEIAFLDSLRSIDSIDLFFHDSDHRYLGQLFEYDQVWPLMATGGLFSSDDVDASRAFIDFCLRNRRKPQFLVDNRKLIGGLRV